MQRDEFKCRDCGDASSSLHVHHLMYKKGSKVWDYDNRLLICLCDSCHKNRHSDTEIEVMLSDILISGIDCVSINMISYMYSKEPKLIMEMIITMFNHIHSKYRNERG